MTQCKGAPVVQDVSVRSASAEFLSNRQQAEVTLAVTKHSGLKAKAEISNVGLLSIAVLVSSILLSTAVLVHVATRDAAHRKLW